MQVRSCGSTKSRCTEHRAPHMGCSACSSVTPAVRHFPVHVAERCSSGCQVNATAPWPTPARHKAPHKQASCTAWFALVCSCPESRSMWQLLRTQALAHCWLTVFRIRGGAEVPSAFAPAGGGRSACGRGGGTSGGAGSAAAAAAGPLACCGQPGTGSGRRHRWSTRRRAGAAAGERRAAPGTQVAHSNCVSQPCWSVPLAVTATVVVRLAVLIALLRASHDSHSLSEHIWPAQYACFGKWHFSCL